MRASPCPACYLCGTPGISLYKDLTDDLFAAPGTWSVKRCPADNCGLLWLDPMPLAADLGLAYQQYYTHGESNRRTLYRFGRFIFGALTDAFLSTAGIPRERRRARLMFLDADPPGSLLDVGCGDGAFIAAMAKRGWQVAGIDFDPAAVAAAHDAHGLDVRVATVESILATGARFDVVTASHVLEHVPDPCEFLDQCRRLLRPGGRVVLKTPNAGSFGAHRYGRAWRGLEPPRHLHIFNLASLASCVRRAGFTRGRYFTTSVGAEGILVASRFLEQKHAFRQHELSLLEMLHSRLIRPLVAMQAKLVWLSNRDSGEEICAVLNDDSSDTAK
jgi:2-polyprenyl-3-methyl-5-hydroxy-6-metoxy-1,4-benzoquinol methylase